jgi:hypothetical protein
MAPAHEQEQIKNTIVKIDFMAGDVRDFLRHLAQAPGLKEMVTELHMGANKKKAQEQQIEAGDFVEYRDEQGRLTEGVVMDTELGILKVDNAIYRRKDYVIPEDARKIGYKTAFRGDKKYIVYKYFGTPEFAYKIEDVPLEDKEEALRQIETAVAGEDLERGPRDKDSTSSDFFGFVWGRSEGWGGAGGERQWMKGG